MKNNNDKDIFNYTYSAKQQEEIKNIRKKYISCEEDKMERLRKLDESVTQKAMTISLIIGVISAIILGIGMCCCMVWGDILFIPGIIIGLVGIVGVSLAYPAYTFVLKKEREKIAPEILRLIDELMK